MLRCAVRPYSGLLALAYTLSFLAVCLGGCLAAAPADHGCCQGEDGLRAGGGSRDCCQVVPGVSAKPCPPVAAAVEPLSSARHLVLTLTVAYAPTPAPASAGPPLILRI